MKLSHVLAIWDKLRVRHTGDLSYGDFEEAVEAVEGVENDIASHPPAAPDEDLSITKIKHP